MNNIKLSKNRTSMTRTMTLIMLTMSILLAGVTAFAGVKSKTPATTPTGNDLDIGETAPDFELTDLDGKTVRLSQFKGKIVVLEWFNPDCPFVKLAHGRALSLKDKAVTYAQKGVVWLAINSNGPGKQGNEKEANIAGRKRFGIKYPILLDPSGTVGKKYGALRTPHIFIIDKMGKLAYSGAVDNTRGGDPEDAEPPPAKNYIDEAIGAVLIGKKPAEQKTEPWGCSVKYSE